MRLDNGKRLTDATHESGLYEIVWAVWDNKYQRQKPVAQLLLEAHPWISTHTLTLTLTTVIPKSLSTLAGSVKSETCPCVFLTRKT